MFRVKERYRKENLEPIVKSSKTIGEVLIKIGVVPTGSSYATFKKHVNVQKIDISHFVSQNDILALNRSNWKFTNKNKRNLDDILKKDVTYSTTRLKRRLIKEGLKEDICEECGQGNIWRGKKITLILDHKNGIRTDFRFENLRIVCPNCNATFDTHCRGTKPKKKKSKKDGRKYPARTEVWKKQKMDSRVVNRPDYFILKKEIENLGYLAVGRKYEVSDNAIRKWVKNYEKNGF